MINITRTIHPVGQGAFYSELFEEDDRPPFLVVYDCGSLPNKDIKQYISKRKGNIKDRIEIDCLFISHIDKDHINGIQDIKTIFKIKKVILPLLDNILQNLYAINLSGQQRNIIFNPRQFFESKNITYIRPINFNGVTPENIESILTSGTSITPPCNQWVYVPFYADETEKRTKFINEFRAKEELKDIDISNSKQIIDIIDNDRNKRKALKDVYKKTFKSCNNSSIILYSGVLASNQTPLKSTIMFDAIKCDKYKENKKATDMVSALYTGDTEEFDLIANDIATNQYINIESIGLIQIPHHGSKNSHTKKLLAINKNCKNFFASFGTTNRYGHPYWGVINDIICSNKFFYPITEEPQTKLTQEITF